MPIVPDLPAVPPNPAEKTGTTLDLPTRPEDLPVAFRMNTTQRLLFATLGPQAANYRLTGKLKPRTGSRSTNAAPRNAYKTKDGKYYWVDSHVIPLLDEHGKVMEFLSIRHEITRRKVAEE